MRWRCIYREWSIVNGQFLAFILVLIVSSIVCSCEGNIVTKTSAIPVFTKGIDTGLTFINGQWLYAGKPFNGTIKELYVNGNCSSLVQVVEGKQQGKAETFYEDGKPETRRWYTRGEKDSIHVGWWPNGQKKFEYNFNNGSYDGTYREWYATGQMLQDILYEKGNEISGKGWRDNGKLYMNFIVHNGRKYGLMNANLCYSLSNEKLR